MSASRCTRGYRWCVAETTDEGLTDHASRDYGTAQSDDAIFSVVVRHTDTFARVIDIDGQRSYSVAQARQVIRDLRRAVRAAEGGVVRRTVAGVGRWLLRLASDPS